MPNKNKNNKNNNMNMENNNEMIENLRGDVIDFYNKNKDQFTLILINDILSSHVGYRNNGSHEPIVSEYLKRFKSKSKDVRNLNNKSLDNKKIRNSFYESLGQDILKKTRTSVLIDKKNKVDKKDTKKEKEISNDDEYQGKEDFGYVSVSEEGSISNISDVSSDDDISIVSDRFSRRADFKRALEFTIKRAEVLHEEGSFDSYEYLKGGQFRSDAKSIYDSNNKIWMEAFWKYVSKEPGPWKISCVPKVFNNTEEWHRWFANYSSQLGMNMVPYDPFFKRAGLSFSIENLKLFGFRTELTYQEKKDRGLVSNSVYIPKVETSNKPKIPVAKPVDSYLENQVIYNGIPMVLGQGLYNFPASGYGFSPQIGCYGNGGSWRV